MRAALSARRALDSPDCAQRRARPSAARRGVPLAWAALAAALLGAGAAPRIRAETLDEAWQAALGADAALQAAQARERAAGSDLAAARAQRRPSVAASTSASRWRDVPAFDFGAVGVPATLPLFAGDTFTMATAQVTLPLYTGGMLGANVAAADAALDARLHATSALTEDLKLGVAEAYIGVLRAASAADVAAANRASLAAHAHDVDDMQRTGQVPRNDALAAAVSLADATQRQLAAGNDLDQAQALYNRRVARPLDAPVMLDPAVAPADTALLARPLEELVQVALARRSELQGLAATAAAFEARSSAARSARRPQVVLQGGYTYLDNQVLDRKDFWSVGVGVRFNVFDAGASRQQSAALAAQSTAVADERTDLATAIELDVRRAWLAVGSARARVGVTQSATAQAEENLRVVNDRYRNGEGTGSDVLEAESLLAQARNNYDAAHYDVLVAQFRLLRAAGAL